MADFVDNNPEKSISTYKLKLAIENHCELDDIRNFCMQLGIRYENLGGDTLDDKSYELVQRCKLDDRIDKLVTAFREKKPNVNIDELYATDEDEELAKDAEKGLQRRRTDGKENTVQSQLIALLQSPYGWTVPLLVIFLIAAIAFFVLWQNNRKDAAPTVAQAVKSEVVDIDTAVPNPTATREVETAVPATPGSTAVPTATIQPAPTIRPVAEDEIMVLVAKFESLTGEEQDVSRFIASNLRQKLEIDIPFSNIRVREYPQIIKTNSQAIAAAEEVGAAVIIWGNYDETDTFAQIQLGSMQPFLQPQLERTLLAENVNVRAKLGNVRQDSIANYVVNIITTQQIASNEDASRSLAINDAINEQPVELLGSNVAVHMQQFAVALLNDEYEVGLQELKEGLSLDGGNAFAYYYRSALSIRIGDFDSGTDDVLTAQRLGPASWSMPSELLGFIAIFQGDINPAIGHFSRMVDILPDEWRSHYYLGLAQLLAGDYATARASMDQAISLEPDVNWPYIFAIQIALREGRLPEAIQLGNTILQKFPDPTYGTRALESTLGGASSIGPIISAFGNSLLGQYQSSLNDVDQALAVNNQVAELHWLRGFAHCNLGDFEEAEAAYSTGIEIDPSFPLNYLSRGALRYYLGKTEGAQADFQAIANSEQAAVYEPLVGYVQAGVLNCQNFLSFDPINLVVVPTIVAPTPLAVEAIEASTQATAVQATTIFIAPNSNSFQLGAVAADESVVVDGRSPDSAWLYIVREDDLEGFVMLDHLMTELEVASLTIRQPKYGVALYNSTVFADSSSSSNILGYVSQNDLVEILGRSPNGSWYYVSTTEGIIGFVSATRVNWQGDKLSLSLHE